MGNQWNVVSFDMSRDIASGRRTSDLRAKAMRIFTASADSSADCPDVFLLGSCAVFSEYTSKRCLVRVKDFAWATHEEASHAREENGQS